MVKVDIRKQVEESVDNQSQTTYGSLTVSLKNND